MPILPSVDGFKDFDMEAGRHEGEVTDVPQGFKDWVGKNEGRIEHAKTMPSFLKDNEKYWEGKGFAKASYKPTTEELRNYANQLKGKVERTSRECSNLHTGNYYLTRKSFKRAIGHARNFEEADMFDKVNFHIGDNYFPETDYLKEACNDMGIDFNSLKKQYDRNFTKSLGEKI